MYENRTFLRILEDRFRSELLDALNSEKVQHGDAMTPHHIVSALNFGFWEHLTTKRFERLLWAKGIHNQFPYAPKNKTYHDLQTLIESARRWRNRIAHHRPVFDKRPMGKHEDAIELITWVCGDTSAWVSASSRVPLAISLRPK